jgi:2-isopropylmalate synthase
LKVFTLDNTFGYNPGRAGLSFSLADKLAIATRFDQLGIDYIEAGSPAANGNILEFFSRLRSNRTLVHARLVASVRLNAIQKADPEDTEIKAVFEAAPRAAVIAGRYSQGAAAEDYCRKVSTVVRLLKARGLEVIFRSEDFFHEYQRDSMAALLILEAAKAAGADVLCLRDTSGVGTPQLVHELSAEVRKRFDGILGICAHDDSELALANTLEAVGQGFEHVEGSTNSYGSLRGLADLCAIISILERKMGHTTIGVNALEQMGGVAEALVNAESAALDKRMRPDSAHEPQIGESVLQTSIRGCSKACSKVTGAHWWNRWRRSKRKGSICAPQAGA